MFYSSALSSSLNEEPIVNGIAYQNEDDRLNQTVFHPPTTHNQWMSVEGKLNHKQSFIFSRFIVPISIDRNLFGCISVVAVWFGICICLEFREG